MTPGMKMPVREVIKLADKDHMSLEWYENHGGQEKKTMEIAYTRSGKKYKRQAAKICNDGLRPSRR